MSKRTARYIILAQLVLCLVMVTRLSGLTFDYDFESLFSTDDPELVFYQNFRERFGNDNDYLLIGFTPSHGIFNSDFLLRLDSLTQNLQDLEEVGKVTSPTNLSYFSKTPLGTVKRPYLHLKDARALKEDSLRLADQMELMRLVIDGAMQSILIMVKHEPIDLGEGKKLTATIETLLTSYGFGEYHLAGKMKAQAVFIEHIQSDFAKFLGVGIFLMIMAIWVIFRSVGTVLVSVAIIVVVLMVTFGLMAMVGASVDVMSALIPLILIIVTISDIVHFVTRYRSNLVTQEPAMALKSSWGEVGKATLLTSLTTALGFFTLVTTSSEPIAQLGLITGSGVLIAYIITFTLFPAFIIITPQMIKARQSSGNPFKLTWISGHTKRILLASLFIALAVGYGASKLRVNAQLIGDLPENTSIKSGFQFFEKTFQGSKPWQLSLSVRDPSKTLYSPEVIAEMIKLEDFILNKYQVNRLVSPLTLVRTYHKAINNQFVVTDETKLSRGPEWRNFRKPFSSLDITDENELFGRFSGLVKDYGSAISQIKDAELVEFIGSNIDSDLLEVNLTGTTYLIDRSHHLITENLFSGLILAVFVVALLIGLFSKSLKLTLISLFCNLLPLALIAGLMGWFGIDLSLSNAIIFVISFGIAVDDTLHFLAKYQMQIRKGHTVALALEETLSSTGEAIIYTSVIIMAGFTLFVFSSFQTSLAIGLLISMTILFALLSDLLLLPALIKIAHPDGDVSRRLTQ